MLAAHADRRTVAIAFALVYGLVAIIGLIDGTDVLGLIPINSADNVLHVAITALGLLTRLMSRDDRRGPSDTLLDRNTARRFQTDTRSTRARR